MIDVLELLRLVVQHGYPLLFAVVFLDHAGLPLPAEPVLLAFGVFARAGHLDPGWGIAAASLGAMAGDHVGYGLGRLGGVRVLRTYCRITLGSHTCVDRAVGYYRRFGRLTVVLGRFLPGVRAFLMPLAGSARLPYRQFLLYDMIGTLAWAAVFVAIGYVASDQLERVGQHLREGTMALGLAVASAFAAYVVLRLRRRRRLSPGVLERPGP